MNGIILAIAVVLQGNNNTAELIEFLSNFSTDIREDGILNSPSLQSKLINSAKLLNTAAVRTNIENKYTDLGVTSAVIPDFETYVQEFIDNTSYVFTSIITYPSTSKYGENLLKVEDTTDASIAGFLASGLAVELPVGTSLQLKMTRESGTGHWFYSISYSEGWKINTYDFVANTQVFESTASGTIDMAIDNEASGITKIEIFENGSLTPTRVKYVKWHE